MKTLEEILFNHISKDVCVGFETGIVGSIKEAMKEYATEYAKEALKNASKGFTPAKIVYNEKTRSYDKVASVKDILSEDNLPKHR